MRVKIQNPYLSHIDSEGTYIHRNMANGANVQKLPKKVATSYNGDQLKKINRIFQRIVGYKG